jgi:peptide/nickel transport system permease protein
MMRHFAEAPWMVLFPGFALTFLVFGVNILGDALRDVLDPRMRGR